MKCCRCCRSDGKLEWGGGTVGTSWIMSSVGSALCLFRFCINLPHELNEMSKIPRSLVRQSFVPSTPDWGRSPDGSGMLCFYLSWDGLGSVFGNTIHSLDSVFNFTETDSVWGLPVKPGGILGERVLRCVFKCRSLCLCVRPKVDLKYFNLNKIHVRYSYSGAKWHEMILVLCSSNVAVCGGMLGLFHLKWIVV